MNKLKLSIKLFPLCTHPYPGLTLFIGKDVVVGSIVGGAVVATTGSRHGGLLRPGRAIPEPGIRQLGGGSFATKEDELPGCRIIDQAGITASWRTGGRMQLGPGVAIPGPGIVQVSHWSGGCSPKEQWHPHPWIIRHAAGLSWWSDVRQRRSMADAS